MQAKKISSKIDKEIKAYYNSHKKFYKQPASRDIEYVEFEIKPSAEDVELANNAITWYQSASYSVASGDVVIAPSADGFKLYIYYYDHNSQVFGAYVADCIKD